MGPKFPYPKRTKDRLLPPDPEEDSISKYSNCLLSIRQLNVEVEKIKEEKEKK